MRSGDPCSRADKRSACSQTALIGIAASLLAGILANLFDVGWPIQFLVAVALAVDRDHAVRLVRVSPETGLASSGFVPARWGELRHPETDSMKERKGEEPLRSTSLFRNRTSNLGLVTQNAQWLLLLGTAFVVSAYLQVVRGYSAIQTGVIFTAATAGILLPSLGAEHFAKRRKQRTLILTGFITGKARSPVSPAPFSISARRWVRRSPGPFWSPISSKGTIRPTRSRRYGT